MAFKTLIEGTNKESGIAYPVEWRGEQVNLPIYKVRYDAPRFNHRNGRIRPHLRERCAARNLEFDEFMDQDFSQESLQTVLRTILENEKGQRKEAMEKFEGGERLDYTKPLIVTHDGRVVNGNQRLSIFSQLVESEPKEYAHLEYPYIALLPDDGQELDYRKIEIKAQENELTASEFDWIQAGLSRRDEIEAETFTLDELAALLGLTTSQLQDSIDLINTVDAYLEFIGMTGMYQSEVREKGLRQSFREVQTGISTLEKKPLTAFVKDSIIKNFCDEAFTVMNTPDVAAGEDRGTYGLVRALAKTHELACTEMVKKKSDQRRTKETRGSGSLRKKKDENRDGAEIPPSEAVVVKRPLEPLPKLGEGDDGRKLGQAVKDRRAVMEDRADASRQKRYAKNQIPQIISRLEKIEDEWEEMDTVGLNEHLSRAHEIIGRLIERGDD